ncbi:peptide deformylase [Patescibacteria group bacterium]|nr:peptide deformylase [Patescibacteria group bacterium]MBU4389928.1 peptide deformylase [Patescibacteria group bacterium]MBU4396805.1 peptide deformylase [Patescibacteria group bacterium]MBU4431602.1 peptide deformylase [Patescibacteria group bacterium]MCG2701892.1 peptide deformylase [Candidatus Parcubacteria bacterium]
MKKILVYPNKVLRVRSKKVLVTDKNLLGDVQDVIEVLKGSENGAGLSAIQIGIKKRFFGIKDMKKKRIKTKIFVNPEIVKTFGEKSFLEVEAIDGGKTDFLEGCLSFPNFFGTVKRWKKIKARWFGPGESKLKEREGVLEGFEAIVFQHELDHLDGILFVDRVKRDGGKFYKVIAGKLVEWKINEILKN